MKFKILVFVIILVSNTLISLTGNEIKDLKIINDYFNNKIDFYLVNQDKKTEDGYFTFSFDKNILGCSDNTSEGYRNKVNSSDVINLGNLYNYYTGYRKTVILSGIFAPVYAGLGIGFEAWAYSLDNNKQDNKLILYSTGGFILGASVTFLTFFVCYLIYTIINYNTFKEVKVNILKKLNGFDVSSKESKIRINFEIKIES
jgi:hypothetical protein